MHFKFVAIEINIRWLYYLTFDFRFLPRQWGLGIGLVPSRKSTNYACRVISAGYNPRVTSISWFFFFPARHQLLSVLEYVTLHTIMFPNGHSRILYSCMSLGVVSKLRWTLLFFLFKNHLCCFGTKMGRAAGTVLFLTFWTIVSLVNCLMCYT